ncbi:MAG: hypothetical protein HRT74_06710, partial [Flavobacteriales bacterium]|nr:hypothetical protein [Flavobacteriales bacterium]
RYNWEEYDLGPANSDGNLNTATGTEPIFRSWPSEVSPTRVFPRLPNLLNNTVPVGELLPYYTRSMTFRCTVRDNRAGGGGVNDAQLSFDVSDQAGPFVLVSPNTGVTWPGNSVQTVTWDVANTNAAPVNCANVDIYLSVDGGLTYPFLLLSGTANDGSADVFIPDSETSTARIKVKGNGNIFFDISNTNFTISPAIGQNDNDAGIAGIASPQGDFCGDQVDPEFTIFNQGALNLTSLDIAYDIDGGTPTSISWTGNLAPGASEVITIPTITVATGPHTFNVNVSNPNGVADDNTTNNQSSSSFSTVSGAQVVTFSLQTDCWGEETSWSLADDQGTVIDSAPANTYADQTLYTFDFCLAEGCYDLTIGDTFGDGLNGTAFNCPIDGDYNVTDSEGTVLVQMTVADFDNQVIENFCIENDGSGCTNNTACNFDPAATIDDGSCEFLSCAGCTDNTACNFDPTATIDDGSCESLSCAGCTDNNACNFDPTATIDDGSCESLSCAGCTNNTACNFDPSATIDDGSCDLPDGCTDTGACNFDPTASCDDGSCEYLSCAGCTDSGACNYDMTATLDDGSCEFLSCAGCTDDTACNYDPTATIDDGNCEYESCVCVGDFNNSGYVDVADLLFILGDFGCTGVCQTDLDSDGLVGGNDILTFLGVFDTACE